MPMIFLTDDAREALRVRAVSGILESESERLPNGLWKTEISDETSVRLRTHAHRGENVSQTVIRICRDAASPLLVSLDEDGSSGIRFHGPEDTVDVTVRNKFQTVERAEIERILGHPITVSDGKPLDLTERDLQVLGAGMEIRETVINNPNLSRQEKLNIIERMRGLDGTEEYVKSAAAAAIDGFELAKTRITEDAARDRRRLDALIEVGVWLQRPLSLAKPDGSALHRLREAGRAGDVAVLFTDESLPAEYAETLDVLHSFVVEHNWAGVLSQAEVIGDGAGELSMPFTASCFEFVVSGKRVMAIINEDPDGVSATRMAILVKLEQLWAVLLTYEVGDDWKAKTLDLPPDLTMPVQPLADLLIDNVRAIGILLETKIVERQVTRIDAKLNRAREKRGKLPLFDYHVVSLARRERAAPRLPSELDPDREITRKRWHLVRGHWRQYPSHRTKIPWHSRGDWDVGIVDKHYRL